MKRRKPARIVPIPSASPGHEGWGWHVHPDDREVRQLPPPPEKTNDEVPANGSNGVKVEDAG